MKIKNKKGIQLNQAFGAVLTLVLVAVLIIVAIYLFTSLSSSTLAKNTAVTAVNETFNPYGTGSYLGAHNLTDGSCGTITAIYNATGQITIPTSNYTQTGCLITNGTINLNASVWNVNYPYTYSAATAASNASDTTISNFSAYPALVGLVGTIIFLGIVIGVLVASFVFGGKRGA